MSGAIKCLHGYATSTDYARLWELAQSRSLVCELDYDGCRDIASTMWAGRPGHCYVAIGVRGCAYLQSDSAEDLARKAAQRRLVWLVPETIEEIVHEPIDEACGGTHRLPCSCGALGCVAHFCFECDDCREPVRPGVRKGGAS